MKSFLSDSYGRTVIIYLEKGEKLLESVTEELRRLDVRYGVLVSAIGALRKGRFHMIGNTEDLPENKMITIENPIELGAAQGLIIDGVPHFHIIFSDPKGTYAGHMEEGCEVQYLAELVVLELNDLNLIRKEDHFGISYLTEKCLNGRY